jgi:hypothetical protein
MSNCKLNYIYFINFIEILAKTKKIKNRYYIKINKFKMIF